MGALSFQSLALSEVDGQAVAGGCQDNIAAVIVENIGAAGDQANIGGTCGERLADSLIAGADGDVDFLDVIAELCELVGEQLL